MKMLPWTLVSVRNGRLWNVTRNKLRTTSLKFLSALNSPGPLTWSSALTFRRVADEASKAETALSGSVNLMVFKKSGLGLENVVLVLT